MVFATAVIGCAATELPAVAVTPLPFTPKPPATSIVTIDKGSMATVVSPPNPTATLPSAPTPCAQPGRVETGTVLSLTAGPLAYRVYLPPCYGADGRTYPTLYLLPGNNHSEAIWDVLGVDEAAEAGILAESWPPFLIVLPAGGQIANNSSGGPGSYESVIMNDLIPFAEQTYCAWDDPAGRAIGGMSRGGYWALEIAFRFPEQFASVGGHSAALLDQYAWPAVNPQHTGLSQNLGDLRIYLDIGANDYVINNIRRLHLDMETAVPPISHTWVLNEGGHEDSYWQAHIPDYLAWYTEPWSMLRHDYPSCSPSP